MSLLPAIARCASLVFTCGGAAHALAPGALDRAAGDARSPALPLGAVGFPAAAAGPRAGDAATSRDLSGAWGAVARGSPGADVELATLDSGFESLAVLPAELAGQQDEAMWGGAASMVTGRNVFAPASVPLAIPHYGVVTETIAGNATKKLRGFVAPPAFGPFSYFGRWCRYDFVKTNSATGGIETRFTFTPVADQNVRIVHDTYVNSIDSTWTSEPSYVASGFIVARLLWGGQNASTGIGLPVGAIPDFFTLDADPVSWFPMFVACQFTGAAPAGFQVGQQVPVPVGRWFRLIHETDAAGKLIHKIDYLDGQGEFLMFQGHGVQFGRIDRMAFAGGMETDNDVCYVDNLHVRGEELRAIAPPPLECANGSYVDDERWLSPGPLVSQSTRWVDALSSRADVIADGADQAIRRTNVFNDDRFRQEIRTLLPATFATGAGSFRVCIEVTIPDSPTFPNATVQTLAPASVTDNEFVTRLFIGRHDPAANPVYTPRMYVQINPEYNPIDDENTLDPYQPGPNGAGGVPVIGADVADTGMNWAFNALQNVCFEVASDRALTISRNGVNFYTGAAFVNSIDQLHLESENNQPGAGNLITYDDVLLACVVLPPVTLPPFALAYADDLEWGHVDVTIGAMDDDGDPQTPFRWASAANMPVVQGVGSNPGKALRMENLFRDTPPGLPSEPPVPTPPGSGFFQFDQASTRLPHVTASATRGWVARCDNLLTDAATSRTWAVGQATIAATQFARCTGVAFSSVTGTFWVQTPAPTPQDPSASTWIDSNTTLEGAGASLNQWFSLSAHRNLDGEHTFRINGRLLRFTDGPNHGQVVKTDSLQSIPSGVHKDMDALLFFASDEDTAPAGSILFTDNIRAWSLPCRGDTNNDGVVNFSDLNTVLAFFTQSALPGTDIPGNVGPDANNDGVPDDDIVNFTDLNLVLSGFGIPCSGQN